MFARGFRYSLPPNAVWHWTHDELGVGSYAMLWKTGIAGLFASSVARRASIVARRVEICCGHQPLWFSILISLGMSFRAYFLED